MSHPRFKLPKTYWAQVEGEPNEAALQILRHGVDLGDFITQPAQASLMEAPQHLWPRDPPVRFRKTVPTHWISLQISEGKNRQVRRMTAKVGLPTLRLVRWQIGDWTVADIAPGTWRMESV